MRGLTNVTIWGKGGIESAEEVMPTVRKWLVDNAQKDNWLLHLNLWDSHTPYRIPASRKNIFDKIPLPDAWIKNEVLEKHRKNICPHGAREINMWDDKTSEKYPRHPGKLETLADVKKFIDLYDCGVQYMDECIGEVLQILEAQGTDIW